MAEDAREEETHIKRGPKGGRKHKPGRGHRHKSEDKQKERIGKRLKERNREKKEKAKRQQEAWDNLPKKAKGILKPGDM